MKIQSRVLSQPQLFTIEIDAEDVLKRKETIFDAIQDTLPLVPGFRQGHVPRDVAELRIGVEKLYKQLIDDVYFNAADMLGIISSRNFKIFGDLKDRSPLKLEFIGEVKPTVELVDLETLTFEKKEIDATNEEIDEQIKLEQKRAIKEIDAGRTMVIDHDCVYIDFEGFLENEKESFKGGSSKNYRLELNKDGKKQFVDNFEDQIVGMLIDETKEINVTFPADYRDNSKAGKKAKFNVKVNSIKQLILPEIEEILQKKNCANIEELKSKITDEIKTQKTKTYNNEFKFDMIKKLIDASKFTPTPLDMIEQELEKEWRSFLHRMGTTEETFLKKDAMGKEYFKQNSRDNAEMLIKTSIIFTKVAEKCEIKVNDDDIEKYLEDLPDQQAEERRKALKGDNSRMKNIIMQTILNDKVITFLEAKFKE
jgi:trigger factor